MTFDIPAIHQAHPAKCNKITVVLNFLTFWLKHQMSYLKFCLLASYYQPKYHSTCAICDWYPAHFSLEKLFSTIFCFTLSVPTSFAQLFKVSSIVMCIQKLLSLSHQTKCILTSIKMYLADCVAFGTFQPMNFFLTDNTLSSENMKRLKTIWRHCNS